MRPFLQIFPPLSLSKKGKNLPIYSYILLFTSFIKNTVLKDVEDKQSKETIENKQSKNELYMLTNAPSDKGSDTKL